MELKEINKRARAYGVPIVKDNTHKILEEFVKKSKPIHILEIGTAVGYSGITMLEASEADLVTIEHNKDSAKIAQKNFKNHKLNSRAKIIVGDCMVALAKLVSSNNFDGYFDFIFLDGPKAQYLQMFDLLMILLKEGGTFVADNVLFRGYVNKTITEPTKRYKTIIKRLGDFIEKCKNSKFLMNFKLIDIDDGIIYAQKVNYEK